MKNYIVTHTFKSKEAKAKMIEVTGSMSMEDMTKAMTSENAKCQMSWNTPGDNLTISVDLINTVALDKGVRFAIREGGRTVGAGQVTEILE